MSPLCSFKLAKERGFQARAPVRWGEQLLLARHHDKAGFFESRLLAPGEGGQLFVSQSAEAFSLPLDALPAAGPRGTGTMRR